jgi:hypothetical protein
MIQLEVIKDAKPLFFDEHGLLVFGKENKLFRRLLNNDFEYIVSVPDSFFNKIMCKSKIIVRLRRLGFGVGTCYRGSYYFTYNGSLYRFEIGGKLTCEIKFKNGHGPLSLMAIQGMSSFDDGLYFGEYVDNPGRKSICIFKRDDNSVWNIAYTFKSNEINHVHSLIFDKFRNCIWIFTGDFDKSACIWMAKDNFKEVSKIVFDNQIYRACVGFPTANGLIYATDTQMIKNSVRLLKLIDGVWVSQFLFDINGPCIYGCELPDYFVISTATEPSVSNSNKLLSFFDCKIGPGIKKKKSDVVVIDKNKIIFRIYIEKKKDFLPFRLFQFGSIHFPSGVSIENKIYCYSVANIGNDLSTEVYKINHL